MKKLNFYFDFLSPYSYFAWLSHKENIRMDGIDIIYKPVLMGKLFSHHGFPGPGEIKSKRDYELKKCFRFAFKNNIKFSPPETFPFNPLAIIRCATLAAAGSSQYEVISSIFDLVWGEGQVLDDPDRVSELLMARQIHKDVIEKSFSREAKLELKANIKEAIELNIFGVPSFSIENEFFWGNDSFDDLNTYLSGDDKWNKELYNRLLKKN